MGLTSRPLRLFSCWPASWRSGSSGASGAARLVATRIATRSLAIRTRPRSGCAGRFNRSGKPVRLGRRRRAIASAEVPRAVKHLRIGGRPGALQTRAGLRAEMRSWNWKLCEGTRRGRGARSRRKFEQEPRTAPNGRAIRSLSDSPGLATSASEVRGALDGVRAAPKRRTRRRRRGKMWVMRVLPGSALRPEQGLPPCAPDP